MTGCWILRNSLYMGFGGGGFEVVSYIIKLGILQKGSEWHGSLWDW